MCHSKANLVASQLLDGQEPAGCLLLSFLPRPINTPLIGWYLSQFLALLTFSLLFLTLEYLAFVKGRVYHINICCFVQRNESSCGEKQGIILAGRLKILGDLFRGLSAEISKQRTFTPLKSDNQINEVTCKHNRSYGDDPKRSEINMQTVQSNQWSYLIYGALILNKRRLAYFKFNQFYISIYPESSSLINKLPNLDDLVMVCVVIIFR